MQSQLTRSNKFTLVSHGSKYYSQIILNFKLNPHIFMHYNSPNSWKSPINPNNSSYKRKFILIVTLKV